MTKLRSFLYLLIIFLTISSYHTGKKIPRNGIQELYSQQLLNYSKREIHYIFKYFTTLIIYKSAPIIL